MESESHNKFLPVEYKMINIVYSIISMAPIWMKNMIKIDWCQNSTKIPNSKLNIVWNLTKVSYNIALVTAPY